MTDKHNFKKALDSLLQVDSDHALNEWFLDYANHMGDKKSTVISALRIADRLQSGEVSEHMAYIAGMKLLENDKLTCRDKAVISFKIMTEQLIKECEDDR